MRYLTEIYRANGSLCYSVERVCYCSQACEVWFTVWRDSAGDLVANAGDACESPPPGPACTRGTCN